MSETRTMPKPAHIYGMPQMVQIQSYNELRDYALTLQAALSAAEQRAEGMRKALDWLETHSTLHTGVEILYVVDGYEVTVMHEDGVTEPTAPVRGDTLLAAIQCALATGKSAEGEA